MKKFFFSAVAAFALVSTQAQSTWKVDAGHSQVKFDITHMGISTLSGNFKEFDATITSSKSDFSDGVFEMTAKAASINTGIEARDKHLQNADFFDAPQYPDVTYKSTGIKKIGENKYQVEGNLTFHGVTKSVPLELWYRGSSKGRNGKDVAGFRATGKINRADFNFGTKYPATALSEEVSIIADGEFRAQ